MLLTLFSFVFKIGFGSSGPFFVSFLPSRPIEFENPIEFFVKGIVFVPIPLFKKINIYICSSVDNELWWSILISQPSWRILFNPKWVIFFNINMFLCFIEFVRDLPKLDFNFRLFNLLNAKPRLFFFVQRNNLYVLS